MTLAFGGVDIGGTTCKVALGDGRSLVADNDVVVVPTTGPSETLRRVVGVFEGAHIAAFGVACFGPLDLGAGVIGATPKHDWQGVRVRELLAEALGVAVVLDSDANGAVWGERALGAGKDHDDVLFVTVSTGIGGGAIVNRGLVHGAGHPEMGHIRIPRPAGDDWPGSCPFHGDCWEGLASGTALAARYRNRAEDLDDERAWALEAHHLALGLANLLFSYRPQRVVLGGGVLGHKGLLEAIRGEIVGLVDARYLGEVAHIDELIVPAALGRNAGLQGALLLAREEYERATRAS